MSALSAVSISKMACVRAQLSLTLCDPMDPMCQPDSSVRGILQARILEWVAISSSRAFPQPGADLESPALAGGFFTAEPPGNLKE